MQEKRFTAGLSSQVDTPPHPCKTAYVFHGADSTLLLRCSLARVSVKALSFCLQPFTFTAVDDVRHFLSVNVCGVRFDYVHTVHTRFEPVDTLPLYVPQIIGTEISPAKQRVIEPCSQHTLFYYHGFSFQCQGSNPNSAC